MDMILLIAESDSRAARAMKPTPVTALILMQDAADPRLRRRAAADLRVRCRMITLAFVASGYPARPKVRKRPQRWVGV